jgi:RNA polymerase sigma-70 factor (ECF subfamily)
LIIALRRAIAIAQTDGPERGIEEIHAIPDQERLTSYAFCHAALGEFELRSGKQAKARQHFEIALKLARNPMERTFLHCRVEVCDRVGQMHHTEWK